MNLSYNIKLKKIKYAKQFKSKILSERVTCGKSKIILELSFPTVKSPHLIRNYNKYF